MIISFLVLALVSVVTALEIFDWDCTNSLGTCNNACFAIKCKNIPGTLTYDSDMAARNPRRTLSGCNRTPCTTTDYDQFGNSCDEYPFASTTEGGEGAILRCVDESENSSEGGQLARNLYPKLANGDQFNVFVKNFIGAYYCEEGATCENDGGEFILSDGNFIDVITRRDKDASSFFTTVVSNVSTINFFRKFMGEDGTERLWLSNDQDANIVGSEIWNPELEEAVRISHEIFD